MRSVARPPRVLCARFEIVAPLGTGGMGKVYRAHDRARGQDVALKILPDLDATALMRFKNEFRALHDVRHPNIVPLYELYEDHGVWFFTMQLVDGVDLLTWVGDDEARLRAVMPQVAQALHRLHCDGFVHRDVKPSNVMVTPAGDAMLLDFGLVAPTWSPGDGAGTPAFMAPEQVDGDVSPASDWYALGVMLFRALTGRLPFIGTAEEAMRAKVERAAPRVCEVFPEAPADLAALADALLATRPARRPKPGAVLAALGVAGEPSRFARNILVGRDRELAELKRAALDRLAGDVFAVSVVGESGIGKTALLRAFAEETEQSGCAWVLSGRCWERESVPYKGFDGVIDELATRLDADGWELRDAGWSAMLAQAFPALRRVRGFADLPVYGELSGRETAARVSSGVRWLFTEIAARQPLVVIIDDLQWADRDTWALLRALIEPPLTNVVLGFGAREPLVLDEGTAVRTIALQPLSQDATAMLVDMIARDAGGHVDAAAVAREAGGHPLFASELARHVAATGELGPITFDAVVLRLIDRFGGDARRIAAVVSLAHTPISIEAIAHSAGANSADVFDVIATLRAAHLVATSGIGRDAVVEPYHDRIRGVLVEQLAMPERRFLHGRIAEALEATRSRDVGALALHWEQAGNSQAAARNALLAAAQAEAALAFHRAAHLYTWALELDPTIPNVRVRQAESLAQAGLGIDAAEAFLACAREVNGVEAIDLRRRAMQQLLLMGHNDRALALLHELMRGLHLPNPTAQGRILFALVGRRLSIRLRRTALPPVSIAEPELLARVRLDVLFDAATGLALVDPVRAFYLHSLNLDMSFRSHDGPRLARALLGEAPFLAASGRTTRRLQRVLELADQASERVSFPALGHLMRGTVGFMLGRWRECNDELGRCERLLQQDRPRLVKEGFGPAQLQELMRRLQLVALFYLGDLRVLRRRVGEQLQDALERNDVTSATHLRTGIQSLLFLAGDETDAALRNADAGFQPWRDSRTGIPHFMDLQARSHIDMYVGRGVQAYRRVIDEWSRLRRAGLFRAQYIHVTVLDTRGRCALAAAIDSQGEQRRVALADARRCAAALRRTAAPWARPLSSALLAGVALCANDHASARIELDRGVDGFVAADMPLHAANLRMVRAALVGDTKASAAERGGLSAAGIVDLERYSRLLLPR